MSGGAIGLLITLLTTGDSKSVAVVVLFLAAALSFVVSLVSVVLVFHLNAGHLERVLKKQEQESPVLAALDNVVSVSFVVGVVLAMVLGVVKGIEYIACGG